LPQRIWASLHDSIGEIVFGMEDGTVSIFGLVFGVAATAPDATTVLLAGATGAAAAAVSMMAGTFLDVESARDQTRAQLADASRRISRDPAA
jgi:VIT1/CCC1 family predicted Fe2+/Mn2+ transporter